MRRLIWLSALGCLIPGIVCHAEDDYDIKVYPGARTYDTIIVDGKMTERSWDYAPLAAGFTYYDRPEFVQPQTFLRVIYSPTHLIFGIRCDEPLMDKLTPVAQARDAHAVFSTEAVEFFVDPKHSHGDYFQFAVNAAGSVYDSHLTEPSWNAKVEAATDLQADHWTIELAIPWADLGAKPEPGTVIGFNVCRDRLIGPQRHWSNWAQTKANFHDPERFAHLVLSPSAAMLGRLGDEFRKGGRTGQIVIYTRQGFAHTTYRALVVNALWNLDGLLAALDAQAVSEDDEASQAELRRLAAEYRAQTVPVRDALAGKSKLDAAEWTRMDYQLNHLASQLSEAVWQARLNALLSRI